ncbi:hypothetical protein [Phytoactinopolyspora mesophila]|uniref:Uncharacterized protein n=1 Tax=Phytoactinopolyspora mesophila TaxID=2650750 RepID=A0A7K3MCH1_9ACTN|nr:hypothetical protein [Phytoactinopolyspora mesophila]NDL60672.1 hypothetical protein [Phytoactinopolyspora mesophila]
MAGNQLNGAEREHRPGAGQRFFAAGWVHFLAILFIVPVVLLSLLGLLHLLSVESEQHSCSYARTGSHVGDGQKGFVELETSWVPLRAVCRWDDGYSLDRVPSYVNPGIATSAAVSVAAIVVITIQNRRLSRESGTP